MSAEAAEQFRIAKAYEAATSKRRQQGDGVVVTPPEIVDFINRAVTDILQDKWGVSVDDVRVFVEDPFAGTGIFGARLLQTVGDDQVQGVVDRLKCIEIDVDAADIAEHNIRRIAYARGAFPPLDRRIVQCADTFSVPPGGER
ncbi:hypothetical protein [Corynebacterium ulceribovis]|uniref:hypothetical protein n=1 Tax=Corynebacterium ulceribovis TaxID=487732 RepID=UPI0003785C71|nr:hypothetical protein [Corynebacterium ulceribovis]